jgi:hypothetical protein
MTDEVKTRKKYKTRAFMGKPAAAGTVEWELLRLKEGETFSQCKFLSMDEATEDKLNKLKNSMRSMVTSVVSKIRKTEHNMDFTISVYEVFDNNRKAFAVFSVAIAMRKEGA